MVRSSLSALFLAVFSLLGLCLPCMARKKAKNCCRCRPRKRIRCDKNEKEPDPKAPAPNPVEEAIGKAKDAGDNAQKAADTHKKPPTKRRQMQPKA